jgi:VWFA-related protein
MKLQLLTVAAISAATLSAPLQAQNPAGQARPVFRSTADVVSIQTSVRDKRGRPMSGLTPTDFEVRDNGHVRPVISLRSDRHAPVSIAVLVDMSGSMRVGPKVAMARQAFGALLAQLREGQDEVAVFTFDSSLHERQPFTNRLATVSQSLVEFSPFGSTSLYDAAAATAKRLSERSATHKAIVILTDGVDTSSALTAPEVSGLASSIDVPVYILATVPVVDQDAMNGTYQRAAAATGADLRDLADWTGGRLVFANSVVTTAETATTLIDELRQQYILAIEAASANEWRRLEVRVKDRGATVKARSGYFGG